MKRAIQPSWGGGKAIGYLPRTALISRTASAPTPSRLRAQATIPARAAQKTPAVAALQAGSEKTRWTRMAWIAASINRTREPACRGRVDDRVLFVESCLLRRSISDDDAEPGWRTKTS